MRGTIGSRILNRSIVKHIPAYGKNKASAGRDYSVIEEYRDDKEFLVAADGYSSQGVMAVIRAVNNLSVSGAAAQRIMISIVAGEDILEQVLRDEMQRIVEYSSEKGFIIAGGNTVYSGAGEDVSFTVTAYGRTKCITDYRPKPGDKIVMFGSAGEYGANVICSQDREKLKERFSEYYLKSFDFPMEKTDISQVMIAAAEKGEIMIHDISFGGVYRALYEIAEYSGCGLDIIHENIPIKQSTIELSEYYNINPYMLLGTGGAVMAVSPDRAEKIVQLLTDFGQDVSVIGELTADKAMTVRSELYNMNRSLTMYDGDEIYKAL